MGLEDEGMQNFGGGERKPGGERERGIEALKDG